MSDRSDPDRFAHESNSVHFNSRTVLTRIHIGPIRSRSVLARIYFGPVQIQNGPNQHPHRAERIQIGYGTNTCPPNTTPARTQSEPDRVEMALRCVALCCAVLQGLPALEPEWHTGIEMLGCIAMCDSMSSVCSSEFVRIMTFG